MVAPETFPGIGPDEANHLFRPLCGHRKIGIAVSGGADSVALMVLLAEWRQRTADAPDMCVFTVDHGLRPEAAHEAETVAVLARAHGLACRVLKWTGEKPASNRQAGARDARFALMREALHAAGGDALVLAHHRDDQAETFLLRLARGSGVYGLSAMAPSARREGALILRPLLGVEKTRLVATLVARGVSWCEDPSNDDPAYARVGMRRLMPELAAEGLTPARLEHTAMRMARAASALDVWVGDVLAGHAQVHPAGPVRLPVSTLQSLPQEVLLRLVSLLLQRVGGQVYPPRIEKLERLLGDLARAPDVQATLAGAVIRRTKSSLLVWREHGRVPPGPLTVEGPGVWNWDRRFAISVTTLETVEVVARADITDRETGSWRTATPADWPAQAFDTAPCVLREGVAPYCPGFGPDMPPAGIAISLLPLIKEPGSTGNSLNPLHSGPT